MNPLWLLLLFPRVRQVVGLAILALVVWLAVGFRDWEARQPPLDLGPKIIMDSGQ